MTLLEDIKKKNRLIQNYVLNKETSGALTSSTMDQNKVNQSAAPTVSVVLIFSERIKALFKKFLSFLFAHQLIKFA